MKFFFKLFGSNTQCPIFYFRATLPYTFQKYLFEKELSLSSVRSHRSDCISTIIHHPLKFLQKLCGMSSVHLCMMELERNSQVFPEKTLFESSPYQERIIENTAIHAYCSIYLVVYECRGADHHALRQIMVSAGFSHLLGQPDIVKIELNQICRKRNVAGTYFPYSIGHNCIHGNCIILNQLVADRKQIEFSDARSSLADAPAHQHIQFQSFSFTSSYKVCHIKRSEKRDHWHRSLHPHFVGIGTCCRCGIYFFLHFCIS